MTMWSLEAKLHYLTSIQYARRASQQIIRLIFKTKQVTTYDRIGEASKTSRNQLYVKNHRANISIMKLKEEMFYIISVLYA